MSEKNVRFVVIGAPKANGDYAEFRRTRDEAQTTIRAVVKDLERQERAVKRAARAAKKRELEAQRRV